MNSRATTYQMSGLRLPTRTIFFLLATGLIVIFITYVYLINKAVLNVVARQKTENEISQVSNTLGAMELQDITLRDNITMDLAANYGLQQISAEAFLPRVDASQLAVTTASPATSSVASALSYNYR